MTFQAFPGRAAVRRLKKSAARPAAGPAPSVNFELPHAGKQDAGIVGIHGHVRATRVFVEKQGLFPGFSSVGGAEDAALRLRPIGVAERAGEHDVWIPRIDDDIADTASFLETHRGPGLARVSGFVNSVAYRNVASNKGLAGSGPDDIGIARSHCQRADRRDWL